MVHVLTGPDHLSAIATLAANVRGQGAFWLGVRWGVGHSTGLLLVGCVFIVLSASASSSSSSSNQAHDDNGEEDGDSTIQVPEHVSHAFEGLVGVFMLLLGLYGLRKAWGKRPGWYPALWLLDGDDQPVDQHEHLDAVDAADICDPTNENNVEDACKRLHHRHAVDVDTERPDATTLTAETMTTTLVDDEPAIILSSNHHNEDDQETVTQSPATNRHHGQGPCCRCFQALSIRSMATVAGIVHGLAGPGGVLGVIPAVQLHDARLASLYLATFCASSTVTMGTFALLYGNGSACVVGGGGLQGQREFIIESLSALLSILVGLLWLALLSLGKLDDVFP